MKIANSFCSHLVENGIVSKCEKLLLGLNERILSDDIRDHVHKNSNAFKAGKWALLTFIIITIINFFYPDNQINFPFC